MIFEQHSIGGDRNFAYLVGDEASGEAAVVDPSYDPQRLVDRAAELGLAIRYVIVTHDHMDHTNGNSHVLSATSATLVGFDVPPPGRTVADGDELALGALPLRFLHTPGHTPDAICVLAGGEKLMTGDTLFVGKVGGTGFGADARAEYDSLHGKLLVLPDEVEVYPGHDYGVRPASTIGEERRTNPFLLRPTFEDFLDLKKNWLAYKQEHGIA